MLQFVQSDCPVYQPGCEPTDCESVLVAAIALASPRSDYDGPVMPILREFFGLSDEEALQAQYMAGALGFAGCVKELHETIECKGRKAWRKK